nr:EAL domain-containing protein [Deinococcus sp. JMULE3]
MFEATFEHAAIGMALTSTDGRFVRVNRSLCDLLGYRPEELLGAGFQMVTHPDDLQPNVDLQRQLLTGEITSFELSKRYVHRDGHVIWAQLNVALIRDEGGEPLLFAAQVQDRSVQREQREQLLALQGQLQLALDGSHESIWDWRVSEGRVNLSDAWLSRLGFDPAQVNGDQDAWVALIHPDDLPGLVGAYLQHAEQRTPYYETEYRIRVPDGSWRWIQLRGSVAERDGAGQPTRVTGTQLDVTERVQARLELQQTRADLQAILDNLPATIGYWDREERNRFSNAAYRKVFGRTPEQIGRMTMRDLLGEELYAQNADAIQAALAGRGSVFERDILTPDGARYMQATYIPDVREGQVQGFYALGTDITARRAAELALLDAQEAYRVTLDGITDAVLRVDPAGRVTFQNTAALDTFGDLLGGALGLLDLPDADGQRLVTRALQSGEVQRTPADRAALLDLPGGPREVAVTVSPLRGADGRVTGAVMVVRDVTESRALTRQMSHLAQHDALTDLPNRVLLLDRVRQATAYYQRQESGFALMFLDLDHFKDINDTLGHSTGDELLRQVAGRLRGLLRAADTVSRLGGDEFVLLLTDLRSAQDAQQVAAKILAGMQGPFTVEGQVLNVTFSAGLALYPEDGTTVEDLMRHADAAMYRAKRDGRNRYHFFSGEVRAGLLARQQLVSDLRAALDHAQFRLHYQPKVDLSSGRVTGVEALLRWPQPDGSMRPPLSFIPLAEETGLIVPIGAWALREACAQVQAWTADLGPLNVSVNVSPAQFSDPNFTQVVAWTLRETGLNPLRLELELTEGMLLQDVPLAQRVLNVLGDLGVTASIDDFGTGFASLSYLKRLPVSGLKIDQSFVRDLDGPEPDPSIVRAILTLSGALNLAVIAEGVETPLQAARLQELGCAHMQGYLFARPLPPDALPGWWRAWTPPALPAQPDLSTEEIP